MLEKNDLNGNWVSKGIEKVENSDGTSLFVERKVKFTGEQWEVIMTTFADPKGIMKLFTARAEGHYVLGKESEQVPGAREIDLNSDSRHITLHQKSLLELFQHACGSINWEINSEEDVSQYGCLSVPSVKKYPTEYDIIKIDENELFFGDYTSDQKEGIQGINQGESIQMDGIFSPKNRPIRLIAYPLEKIDPD